MLTEKECKEALDGLRNLERYENFKKWNGQVAPQVKADVIEQLIREHFSNPPLKFDELNKGYPIYDNDEIVCGWKFIYMIDKEYKQLLLIDEEGNVDWVNYEENRFYRKEVQE